MIPYFTLLPEAVATVRAETKLAILEQLAARFAAVYDLDRTNVLERIEERERLGSTGFGRGFAIPHAHIEGLNRPVAAFLRLESAVDFEAVDSMPVDLVFGLLSPETAGASHLHALAAISRAVRDDRMHEALVRAPHAEALYGLLCNVDDRDAA
ncbi:MAG: PTS sugar transporter subunit IIA [Novosphingobium sp.]|nr:PTS sugar transporter subunit IIA [Novosphingobium sp.]